MTWHKESRRHSLAARGIKTTTQPVTRVADLMKHQKVVTGSELQDFMKIQKTASAMMRGEIPEGKLDIIYYYILEDNNYHSLNNKLTKEGRFGPYETHKYPDTTNYSPKAYADEASFERFKRYRAQTDTDEYNW